MCQMDITFLTYKNIFSLFCSKSKILQKTNKKILKSYVILINNTQIEVIRMPKIGIIGGSGIYNIQGLKLIEEISINTPYGAPSYSILESDNGSKFAFLNRHGIDHNIAPHMINYRANICGFKEIGVTKIISICAVGGINKTYIPGDIVIPDQIIDVTSDRVKTFYDNPPLYHVDFSNPFCPQLREYFINSASKIDHPIHKVGTYICTNGPRLESSAEIKYYSIIGADLVGMTGMPETILARELELCYASIAVITNFAAGILEQPLTVKEVIDTMAQSSKRLNILLKEILLKVDDSVPCSCNSALKEASF